MKVVIIDDEPLARDLVKEYLQGYNEIELVAECGDGFEGLKAIHAHKPDLIFLDIQMPKISGFEMLELVDDPPCIIFTTAFDEYAIRAFDTNAIDYLLKPFSKERFDKAMQKCLSQITSDDKKLIDYNFKQAEETRPEEKNRIVVKTNAGIRILPVTELVYLEAYDDYVKIHTKEGMFLKKKTLTYYENTLGSGDFLRVHRSFLLRIDQITRIEQPEKETHVALLKNGVKIPLSRAGYAKLVATLGL